MFKSGWMLWLDVCIGIHRQWGLNSQNHIINQNLKLLLFCCFIVQHSQLNHWRVSSSLNLKIWRMLLDTHFPPKTVFSTKALNYHYSWKICLLERIGKYLLRSSEFHCCLLQWSVMAGNNDTVVEDWASAHTRLVLLALVWQFRLPHSSLDLLVIQIQDEILHGGDCL